MSDEQLLRLLLLQGRQVLLADDAGGGVRPRRRLAQTLKRMLRTSPSSTT